MLFVKLFFKIRSIFKSVCSIVKMFAQNKDDRKRVEKALDISGFPSGKVSSYIINISPEMLYYKILFIHIHLL